MATATLSTVEQFLGAKAESLLGFKSPKISKDRLHIPGPDFIDRIYAVSDRNLRVLNNLHRLFFTGGSQAPDIFRFCRSIRASNIPRAQALRKIRTTSTAKTS